MKRLAMVILVSSVVAFVNAAPVVSGGEGLARIVDARNEGLYNWTAGVSFAGIDHGAEHMNDLNIQTWRNSVLRVFGSWVPFNQLEVIGSWGAVYSYPSQTTAIPSFGLWDIELGAKYTIPLEFWTVGFDSRIYLPTHSSFFGPPSFGGVLRVIGTSEMGIFTTHMNLGAFMRQKPGVMLGAGTEVSYEYLNPYIELSAEVMPDSFPLRLTPGLRIKLNSGISFFYAADFGLNLDGRSVDARGGQYINQISAGVAYSPSERVSVAKRPVALYVKALDASTGEPVAAEVNIANHYPSVFALGMSGERTIEVQSGRYQVTIRAPGYLPQTYMMTFKQFANNSLEVRLEPDRTGGYLDVRILDSQTARPISGASVSVAGITLTTNVSGETRFILPSGNYDVNVSMPGYISQNERIILSQGIPMAINLSLLRNDARIRISGIRFASGSAVIDPESYQAIDEAVRFLKTNPTVRVEIQGHTDSQGSYQGNLTLSQERAQSVRDYLIRVHGISADRLEARGYGSNVPVASNDTEAGRSQNRRVELVVIK